MPIEKLLNQTVANRDQKAIALSPYREVIDLWKTKIGRFVQDKGVSFRQAFAGLIHEVSNMDVSREETSIQMQALGLAAIEYLESVSPEIRANQAG